MGRGEFQVIRDPAIAVAAAKCWIARWGSRNMAAIPVDSFHPEDCAFCDLNSTYLIEAIEEFLDWGGLREKEEPGELKPIVESFLELTTEAQARAVATAQGYTDG